MLNVLCTLGLLFIALTIVITFACCKVAGDTDEKTGMK